jgi:hypothetical protein
MASEYQVLENGNVVNTIVASEEFMQARYPDGNYRLAPIGNGTQSPTTETQPDAARRIITIRALKQRFTQAERVAVRLASADDVSKSLEERQQAAALADWQDILNSVQFVDLDFSETIAAVELMESAGLLAEGRAAEILGAAVTDEERPES